MLGDVQVNFQDDAIEQHCRCTHARVAVSLPPSWLNAVCSAELVRSAAQQSFPRPRAGHLRLSAPAGTPATTALLLVSFEAGTKRLLAHI